MPTGTSKTSAWPTPCWACVASARASTFLGSYPRADRAVVRYPERYADDVFVEARDWLRGLISGEPELQE